MQFNDISHPHAYGWHLYRRKDFRRWRRNRVRYNRIKDELGYTPRRDYYDVRAAQAKPIVVDAAPGPDKTAIAMLDVGTVEQRVFMHIYSESDTYMTPETFRALQTMGMAAIERKDKQ